MWGRDGKKERGREKREKGWEGERERWRERDRVREREGRREGKGEHVPRVSFSFYKDTIPIMRASPLWSHVNPIIFQRPHFKMPPCWGLRLQHMIWWNKHSVYNTDVPWWQAGGHLSNTLSLQKVSGPNLGKRENFQEKKKKIKLPIITAGKVLRIWFLVHSLKNKDIKHCVDTWVYRLRVTPTTNYYHFLTWRWACVYKY